MRRPLIVPHGSQQRVVLRARPTETRSERGKDGWARMSRTTIRGHAVAHETVGIAAIDQQEVGIARPDLVHARRRGQRRGQVFALRQ